MQHHPQQVVKPLHIYATAFLILMSPLLVVFAGPLTEWSLRAAQDLHAGISLVQINGGVR